MYYNIKIKSNGSEFSLESNNKEVTQREMDTYFAAIFDVSEEFRSNIKKVEITNENVKSISEVENPKVVNKFSDEEIERLAKAKAQEIIDKARVANLEKMQNLEGNIQNVPENTVKEIESAQKPTEIAIEPVVVQACENDLKQVVISNVHLSDQPKTDIQREVGNEFIETPTINEIPAPVIIETTIPTVTFASNASQGVIEEIKFTTESNENLKDIQTQIIQKDEYISSAPVTENIESQLNVLKNRVDDNLSIEQTSSQNVEIKDEIQELIMLAQQKISLLEQKNTEKQEQVSQNDEVVNVSIENKKPFNQKEIARTFEEQTELYNINNQAKLDSIFVSDAKISEESISDVITEETSQIDDSDKLEVGEAPQISIVDVELNLQANEDSIEDKYEISSYENDMDTQLEAKVEEEKVKIAASYANQIDFKPFLSSFPCSEIFDEFVVCAYFIKNVINQQNFTIKFINSKLFQATGKIADMSIVDELISKEYIKVIETEEGKKYCISANGESYFVEKFQG